MTDTSPPWTALDLERLDGDRYLAAPHGSGLERTFGGLVLAQALRAAGHTVDGSRHVHSLHSYFIRGGRPGEPVRFDVTRTRDGRAFSTRNVTAHQEGKPIFEMIASFQDPEPGEDWQAVSAPPSVPLPEDLRPVRFSRLFGGDQPVEIRPVTPRPGPFPIAHPFWVRASVPVGAEPARHACLLAFVSDIAVVRAAQSPGPEARFGLRVSVDHSIWFHRPPRADQWLLYSMDPVAHVGTRALAQGSIRTADGTLIASVAQEALLRPATEHAGPAADGTR